MINKTIAAIAFLAFAVIAMKFMIDQGEQQAFDKATDDRSMQMFGKTSSELKASTQKPLALLYEAVAAISAGRTDVPVEELYGNDTKSKVAAIEFAEASYAKVPCTTDSILRAEQVAVVLSDFPISMRNSIDHMEAGHRLVRDVYRKKCGNNPA